jgi:hypothetical protein
MSVSIYFRFLLRMKSKILYGFAKLSWGQDRQITGMNESFRTIIRTIQF